MRNFVLKHSLAAAIVLIGTTHFGFGATRVVTSDGPDLPAVCNEIRVEAGNQLAFHAYAIGVQIYRWNGAAWELKAPDANLYADRNYRGQVGIHYAGPKWESNSGSVVKASRLNGCDVDPTHSIQWLLLRKDYTEGNGIFNGVTFIQRVNTSGGLKPTEPGMFTGEEKRIPYTAEYYFYRSEVE